MRLPPRGGVRLWPDAWFGSRLARGIGGSSLPGLLGARVTLCVRQSVRWP